jgi:hypothetical protein
MTKLKAINTKEKIEEHEEGDLRVLTTGLAAICKAKDKFVSEVELNAVLGMISYVAHKQNVGENIVGEVVTSHFGISSIEQLPSNYYKKAIDYLDNLKMDKIVN